ncbi:hypothetical protein [Flavobacterium sp. ZS1P14]|uniref:hypothetical protein n=1 Tax=Flavobacterium sp. ZS1P14 TaxID=3401729 RepID=UPI003AADEC7E
MLYFRKSSRTLSSHFDNPLTEKNVWDTTPKSLALALSEGESHEKFKSWLDEAAKYILTLKDEKRKTNSYAI